MVIGVRAVRFRAATVIGPTRCIAKSCRMVQDRHTVRANPDTAVHPLTPSNNEAAFAVSLEKAVLASIEICEDPLEHAVYS